MKFFNTAVSCLPVQLCSRAKNSFIWAAAWGGLKARLLGTEASRDRMALW